MLSLATGAQDCAWHDAATGRHARSNGLLARILPALSFPVSWGSMRAMSVQEFAKYDAAPEKLARSHSFWDPRAGSQRACSAQHERFLAPEVFFRPDFVSDDYTTPLPPVQSQDRITCLPATLG